jgi:hypothetical protein
VKSDGVAAFGVVAISVVFAFPAQKSRRKRKQGGPVQHSIRPGISFIQRMNLRGSPARFAMTLLNDYWF